MVDTDKYLITTQDPALAPKLAPMMRAIRETVGEDGAPWPVVRAAAVAGSECVIKTADTMLHRLVKAGWLTRTGEYDHGRGSIAPSDGRQLHLADWRSGAR